MIIALPTIGLRRRKGPHTGYPLFQALVWLVLATAAQAQDFRLEWMKEGADRIFNIDVNSNGRLDIGSERYPIGEPFNIHGISYLASMPNAAGDVQRIEPSVAGNLALGSDGWGLVGFAMNPVLLSKLKPSEVIKEPVYRSAPKYATIRLGNGPNSIYVLALDEPVDGDYRIYLDRNRNGDLTDDGDGAWIHKSDTDGSIYYMSRFTLRASYGTYTQERSSADYTISFGLTAGSSDRFTVSRASTRVGTVSIEGKPRKVVLAENDADGLFNKPIKDAAEARNSRGILLRVDLKDDGTYTEAVDIRAPFKLGGKVYEARVSDDGSSLEILPTDKPNPEDELTALRQKAEQGDADAQFKLGKKYTDCTCVQQDFGIAVQWFRKAADQGLASAQYSLGTMYANGRGVGQDYGQAIQWFRKAAEQGDASAQYVLGLSYNEGLGVAHDPAEVVKWLRKAADQGLADAQSDLGAMYADGHGIPQDYGQALRWFRKAAEQDFARAQFGLGVAYASGQGVAQDFSQAVQWFRRAAEQGLANAQFSLGLLYRAGQGAPQDYVEAHEWLTIASARASGESQKAIANAREEVEEHMTPTQIAEAKKRAREWTEAFARRKQ